MRIALDCAVKMVDSKSPTENFQLALYVFKVFLHRRVEAIKPKGFLAVPVAFVLKLLNLIVFLRNNGTTQTTTLRA